MSALPGLILVLITPDGAGSGGGTQQVLRRMIPRWVAEGRHVTLLTHPVDARWDGLPDGVDIIALLRPSSRAMHSVAAIVRSLGAITRSGSTIRRVARSRPEDIVLPFLPGASILTIVAMWGRRNRVIPCERNDPTRQRFSAAVRIARRLLYSRATAVTVNTQVAQDAFVRILRGRVPVHVVMNPLPDWPEPVPHGSRERLLVSVGRLVPQKRHDDVIRAFAGVSSEHPEWRLDIVGEGPERARLEQLIDDLGLAEHITLLGHRTDVRAVLDRARILVLASEFEGTPNALLEGLLAGLHGVVSDAVPPLPSPLEPLAPLDRFPVGDVAGLIAALHAAMHRNGAPVTPNPGLNGIPTYRSIVAASWDGAFTDLSRS